MCHTQVTFLRSNVQNLLIFLFISYFQGVPGLDNIMEGPKGLKGEHGQQVIPGAFVSELVRPKSEQ